ncbi:MAG TPA: hypothetical protein VFD49_10320 [Candidatus Dormibacteraeota bacterium]|nr:hypothetical protein [Candidatus Dormibacteraeota bacterium]
MRRKTTVYIDERLLRAAKVEAASSGRREYEVFEEAIRDYLGWKVVERVRARAGLGEEEAMEIAREELSAYRQEQDRTTTCA